MAQGRRIDRRGDHAADLGGEQELHLLDHLGGIVVGQRPAILKAAVLGGHCEAVVDALHELALVVLREGEHLLEARRRRAGGGIRIERLEDGRRRDARRAVLGRSG